MRTSLVVFGLAVAVVGVALWYAPLVSSSTSISVPVGHAYDFGVSGTLIIGPIPFTASWTSTVDANVTVYACGTSSACAAETNGTVVAHGSGMSGSIDWSSKAGQYYLLVPSPDATVTVSYVEPVAGGFVGVGVLGLGVLVVVVGLAVGRRESETSSPPRSE
ncbi:MAG: hypothetical protein L3K00_05650 [Thermoplasmata archaeon]|nr:hypothetical protein [Thermoplasmata archaeon]